MIRNNPVFELNFNGNMDNEGFVIRVKDEYGTSLYSEKIIGRQFSKKYMLDADEIGESLLRFEIISKSTGIVTWYEVNATNRFVQNWIVRSNSTVTE